jgi:ankyrin repeat protein
MPNVNIPIEQKNPQIPTHTNLHEAVKGVDKEVVASLLAQGAPVDVCDNEGRTPLFIACQFDCDKMMPILQKYNATLGVHKQELTPLEVAASYDSKAVVKALHMSYSEDVILIALQRATVHSSTEVIQFLVGVYPQLINRPDRYGMTLLHWACMSKTPFPQESAFSDNLETKTGDELKASVESKKASTPQSPLQILLLEGGDIDLPIAEDSVIQGCSHVRNDETQWKSTKGPINVKGFSPLMLAIVHNQFATASFLVQCGAGVMDPKRRCQALDIALKHSDRESPEFQSFCEMLIQFQACTKESEYAYYTMSGDHRPLRDFLAVTKEITDKQALIPKVKLENIKTGCVIISMYTFAPSKLQTAPLKATVSKIPKS